MAATLPKNTLDMLAAGLSLLRGADRIERGRQGVDDRDQFRGEVFIMKKT